MIRANIYRPKRKRDGKRIVSPFYVLRWKQSGERRYQSVPLRVRDKQVAQRRLAEFIAEKEREAGGVLAPRPLREAAAKPMADHLADYLADLRTMGRDSMYVKNARWMIGRLLKECRWTR